MTKLYVSRREMLIGAGGTALGGLIGCNRALSPLVPMPADSIAGLSAFDPRSPAVAVPEPSGEAIQAAIDQLGSGGGSIYLTATVPYVIDKQILIASSNIKLIGKGASVTTLLAKMELTRFRGEKGFGHQAA